VGAKNLFVGILGLGKMCEKEMGWKKSQPILMDPYFS
jgi:hypothetical protein